LIDEARAIEKAVSRTLANGHRTRDLAQPGQPSLTTSQMTAMISGLLLDENMN